MTTDLHKAKKNLPTAPIHNANNPFSYTKHPGKLERFAVTDSDPKKII